MPEREEWNAKVIEELRANKGVVGGPFDGIPLLLLLHHVGAKIASYEAATTRQIPVVVLDPVA